MSKFNTGDHVKWNWGDGEGTGRIVERHTSRVTKSIKGTEITRNASTDEPAFLIEQSDGDQVLKSCTELEHA